MDMSKIGVIAAEAMEVVDRNWSDTPTARIVEVGVAIHIQYEDEFGRTHEKVDTACGNISRIYQSGLFDWAYNTAASSGEPEEDDE